jgi:hypothetical protein
MKYKTTQCLISSCFIALFVIITSCSKKGCTDSSALNFDATAKKNDGSCEYPIPDKPLDINSPLQYKMEIDGVSFRGSVYNQDTLSGQNSRYASAPLSGKIYGSIFYINNSLETLIKIEKGTLNFNPTEAQFKLFLSPGEQTFPNLVDVGVIFSIQTPLGVTYTSRYGDQTGSSCTIVETKDEYIGNQLYIKTFITFNCKVYNANNISDVKTITNGEFVNYFTVL